MYQLRTLATVSVVPGLIRILHVGGSQLSITLVPLPLTSSPSQREHPNARDAQTYK